MPTALMHDYWIQVLTPDGGIEGEAHVPCESDDAAIALAAITATPFGHQLRSASGFLGRFEALLARPEERAED